MSHMHSTFSFTYTIMMILRKMQMAVYQYYIHIYYNRCNINYTSADNAQFYACPRQILRTRTSNKLKSEDTFLEASETNLKSVLVNTCLWVRQTSSEQQLCLLPCMSETQIL